VREPRIVYTPRCDATPEMELSALANVYAFILDGAKKRGRLPDKSGPDDAERKSNAIGATRSISE
jgi:hypothetical protein